MFRFSLALLLCFLLSTYIPSAGAGPRSLASIHDRGGGGGLTMPADREQEIRERLRADYRPLIGTYRGLAYPDTAGAKPVPVELKLFLVEIEDGVNSNQELVFRPELRGFFTHLNVDLIHVPSARRPILFRFYKDSREIAFANWDRLQGPSPGVGFVSVSGRINADWSAIDGEIHLIQGSPLDGTVKLQRVSP